jgi:peptidoglycan/LPS O-acetylase OafA/YrhL
VLIEHFLPKDHPFRTAIPWGDLGVQLFFVLSGFLITGILLRCRSMIEDGQPLRFTLRQFYVRRSLRIFPLFYAAVLTGLLFDLGMVRRYWPWHVAYLSNFGVTYLGNLGTSGHFWSLSVEEQFYLVWPMVILITPARYLIQVLVLAISTGPLFRLAMALSPLPWGARMWLMPACLDTLAAGGLLAYLWTRSPQGTIPWRTVYAALFGGMVIAVGIIGLGGHQRLAEAAYVLLGRTAMGGIFVFLVYACARGLPGLLGSALARGPLAYIGKISYGIYILHPFVSDAFRLNGMRKYVDPGHNPIAYLFLLSSLSVLAASLSWKFFENPINSLKDRFPYRQPRGGDPGQLGRRQIVASARQR